MTATARMTIPARFILTTGHLIALVMVLYTKGDNIHAGNAADEKKASREVDNALITGLVCFLVEYVGMLSGATLFFTQLNFFHALVHLAGGCAIATFIEASWDYRLLWNIVGVTCVTPAALELAALVAIFVLNVTVY